MNDPFYQDPRTLIGAAQTPQPQPMPGRVPVEAFGATRMQGGGSGSLGPSHDLLQQQFRQSLQQQNGVQGLLQQMIGNPAMAQQMGGLLGAVYTPPKVQGAWRGDWGDLTGQQIGPFNRDAYSQPTQIGASWNPWVQNPAGMPAGGGPPQPTFRPPSILGQDASTTTG